MCLFLVLFVSSHILWNIHVYISILFSSSLRKARKALQRATTPLRQKCWFRAFSKGKRDPIGHKKCVFSLFFVVNNSHHRELRGKLALSYFFLLRNFKPAAPSMTSIATDYSWISCLGAVFFERFFYIKH